VKALKRSFQGCSHQRCRVHFARNLLAHVPKTHADMVAAVFRTIFAQPDPAAVSRAWEEVRDQLAASFPKVGPLMDAAKPEVLAFTAFPKAHWRKIWSTNPLETRQQGDQTPQPGRGNLPAWFSELGRKPVRADCHAGRGAGGDPNLSVRPWGLDLVGASPLGSSRRWSRDLRAAC
jgi:hypothetical protein